jgi:hypothetical protein
MKGESGCEAQTKAKNMKTLKTWLVIAAASTTFSLMAADSTQDPNLTAGPRLGKATPNVLLANPSTTYQDPNLIPEKAGKRTVEPTVTAGPNAQNENTLVGTNCQGMPSKTKDTAACAKHCAKLAKQ